MRTILHIIIIGFFVQNISGKTITISGKILNEFDYSIPAGRIDNLTIDSTYYSDLDRMFKIKCFEGDSIRFSAIGTQDSLICFYSDTIVEIVLLHNGYSHSDGYKFEFKHNVHGLLGFDNDNFIIDYRYSWNHFSKKEIGRKPIHLITNHIDIGLSYLNSDTKYISGFFQLNDFFKQPLKINIRNAGQLSKFDH